MTPAEAAALLGIAASFDNRKPDEDAATAWAHALDGFRFLDCRDAIVAHYRASSEWLMPSMVIAGVKRLRAERVRAFGTLPDPPPGLDPDNAQAYTRWLDATTRAIADGELEPEEPATEALPRRDVIAALGHIGQHVDDARTTIRAAVKAPGREDEVDA